MTRLKPAESAFASGILRAVLIVDPSSQTCEFKQVPQRTPVLPLRRRIFQEPVVRKLSLILSTILWNFGNGTANESVFLPTQGLAEMSNIPKTHLGRGDRSS